MVIVESEKQIGFSLIELLVAIAIIGIISAIAVPSYLNYLNRTHRADAMAEMQQIASRIEANKVNYKRYDRIPLSTVYETGATITAGGVSFPYKGTALYTVTVTPNNGTNISSNSWTITATPSTTAKMKNDGTLTIDSTGQKCWNKTTTQKFCGKNSEWRN